MSTHGETQDLMPYCVRYNPGDQEGAPPPLSPHVDDYMPCCYEYPTIPAEAYDELIIVRTKVENSPGTIEDFQEWRGVLSILSPHFKIMLDTLIRTPVAFELDGHPLIHLGVANTTWRLFRDWMFRGGNVTTNVGDGLDRLNLHSAESRKSLLKLYAFAERNRITDLQNAVLGLYFTRCASDEAAFWHDSHAVYANSKTDSPLRELYIEMLIDFWRFDHEAALNILDPAARTDYLHACLYRNATPGRYEQYPTWLQEGEENKYVPCPKDIHVVLWKEGFCNAFHTHTGEPVDYTQEEWVFAQQRDCGIVVSNVARNTYTNPDARGWLRIRFVGHPEHPWYAREDKDGLQYPVLEWNGYLYDRRFRRFT